MNIDQADTDQAGTLRTWPAPRRGRIPFTDYGGAGPAMLALHGHFGSARTFASLAMALQGQVRVIAVDQRGHGHAERGGPYTPDAYVDGMIEFIEDNGLTGAVVYGHSMGGVCAYRLAARRPDLVAALVVEEAPAVIEPLILNVRGWPRRAGTLGELGAAISAQGIPDPSYFLESAVRYADGWGLAFDCTELMSSQELLVGDWWKDWLAVECPTLLLHGHQSNVLATRHAREMTERRPSTTYVEFPDAGHFLYDDDVAGVTRAVTAFVADAGQRPGAP